MRIREWGRDKVEGRTVLLSREEAIRTISSLAQQLESGRLNPGQEELCDDDGMCIYFNIGVDQDYEEILSSRVGSGCKNVSFTYDTLIVDLKDGRTIMVPLSWYPRLLQATSRQRDYWEISGGGSGIHWPQIDEDLSIEGLLRGVPAPDFK